VTNVDLHHRKDDFDSQFAIVDKSPVVTRTGPRKEEKTVEPNRAKVLKGMDSTWDSYGESPDTASKKENIYRIKLGGDGMGGLKGTQQHWYDEDQA
jgi:hypothetical protein